MVNYAPDFCPYCGTEIEVVDPPTVYRCDSCDDWVFHNAVLGGGTAVVDGDSILLVEDFRNPGAWTLPEGRPEIGEAPRAGVTRELEEEAGLTVDPADLVYLYDNAAEPVPDQHMMGMYFAVDRSDTTGPVESGSDAIDARFWTPDELERSDQVLTDKYENPFWYDDLALLHELASRALERDHRYATLIAPHVDE